MAKKTNVKVKKAATPKGKSTTKKVVAKASVADKKVAAPKKANTPKTTGAKKASSVKTAIPKKAAIKKAAAKKVEPKKVVAKKAAPKKAVAAKKEPPKKTVLTKKDNASKQVVSKKATVKKVATKKEAPAAVKKAAVKKPAVHTDAKKNTPKVAAQPKKAKVASKKPAVIKNEGITKKVKKEAQPLKEVRVPKISTTSKTYYNPSYTPMAERSENINQEPLVRYSEEELNEFKALILKKLADARREASYLQGIITRRDDMGGDIESRYMTMEDGTISMEREQQSQMASRQINYIDNLEKAIIRIENKTYGVCRITGRLIDKARLRAVPHATLSIEAKLNRRNSNEQ